MSNSQRLEEPDLTLTNLLWVVCTLRWEQFLLDGKGYKSSIKCPILFNFLTPTIFSHLNLPLLSSLLTNLQTIDNSQDAIHRHPRLSPLDRHLLQLGLRCASL